MQITVNIEDNTDLVECLASIERLVKTFESSESAYVSMEDFYTVLNLSIKVLYSIDKRGLASEKRQFIYHIEESLNKIANDTGWYVTVY